MPVHEPVRYAALTDVGVKRSHNQDACAAQPAADEAGWVAHGHVFVVADGMGGHAVGEKASAKAVRDIPFLYLKHAHEGVVPAIRRAFQEANTGIFSVGQENPEFRGMGTTSTALVIRPEGAWVGHVGDSRAYRIRDCKCEQLTFDHSWVWEIARRQGVDPDELGDFKKNVIIRSLGPDPDVEVDIEGPHPVQVGDQFLLCSDGLTNVVTPDEIGAVVAALPPDIAVRLLVNLANLRGGPDNITVMIVQVGDQASESASPLKRFGLVGRLVRKWGSLVPWPITCLGGGIGLAILALAARFGGIPGAMALFGVAAVVIVAGLVGLVIQLRRETPETEAEDDGPRELNVYKRHDCPYGSHLTDRFAQLEGGLVVALKNQGVEVDWSAHEKLVSAAEAEVKKGDGRSALKARCLSLLFLAETFHKSRHKEEKFRPSW